MKLAQTISRQKRAILSLIAILCLVGVWCAATIPTSIFPQTDFPRIVVRIDAGEMASDQMLASITRPVEEAMNGVPGAVAIRSDTGRGAAQIDVFFDWGADPVLSLQLVESRLADMRTELPSDVTITAQRLTFAVFPIIGYSLTSDTRDSASLRDTATLAIAPRLARLPGISSVGVLGGKVHEFHARIDPGKLYSAGLGLSDVTDAVAAANIASSPGFVEANHQLDLLLVSGQVFTKDELARLVVGAAGGRPVLLSDVATIVDGIAPDYVIVTADGKPAVLLNILRQPDANTVTVADEVKQELAAMRADTPPDIVVAPFYDQSLLVRSAIGSVRDAVLIGLALSILILFLVLHDWGTTIVAAMVIPVTLLLTFVAMKALGLGFDLMTLGGIAAAIGLVIDDAIVVVENIHTHMLRGEDRQHAVATAVTEILGPIVGSTLTPVVVFLPLTILEGISGVFFRALAATMVVALLTSLVLALVFTPALAERFIRPPKTTGAESGRFMRWGEAAYEWTLNLALARKPIVFVLALVVAAASVGLYRLVGTDFLPQFDEGAFVLDYVAPPGASLAETDRILKKVEAILAATPEVESYSRRTGAQLGLAVTEPNTGDFLVKLKRARSRTTEEVTGEIRERIEREIPEETLEIEFAGILNDLVGDLVSSPSPIEIKLFSTDAAALAKTADSVEAAIQDIPGVVDTFNGIVVSGPVITFRFDPVRAAQYATNPTEVAEAATTAVSGRIATSVLDRGRLVAVRVVLPDETRASVDTIRAIPIRSKLTGATFRLDQVADVVFDPGQTELHRDNLRQAVAVTARIETEKTDLGAAISAIQRKLASDVRLPPGVTVEYGGLYREQQSSFARLVVALLLAVLLVYLVLLVEFRSFTHPTAIVGGAVLALGGVLAALILTGQTLNVVSFVGAIMVVGIVAKNGILMLDTVEERLDEGLTLEEALVVSGHRRLRPVIMTSLAAILGMMPLALALGEGAQMLQPLAIAVIGGLTVALVLSLVLTPVLFAALSRQRPKSTDAGQAAGVPAGSESSSG